MVADQTIRDADANAQGSTTMADLMAGLPPLLLGTYTPKIVGTRAELWNKDTWESYLAEKEEGYSDIADDVLPEVEF